ncbi:hypothetical protein DPMN_074591 [Dreissena polymorpha]|uniref:Uncharacterized protein n=1 Tax=Dreissena polymorpha TaxID=45954 RepID=A0A9D4BNJ3_DREPO|nr:hypothetical protein DPMN_074591 [Dreissena polymorpha]
MPCRYRPDGSCSPNGGKSYHTLCDWMRTEHASIKPYKKFVMAIAFTSGGQYVPLTKAQVLSQVIVGGNELGTTDVNLELQADLAAGLAIDEDDMTKRVHAKMASKGIRSTQL